MGLTWRDGVATLLVGVCVALYAAYLADAEPPFVSGPRALAGALLVIGLGACAIGGGGMSADDMRSAYTRWICAFGAVPGIAAVIALITGSAVALAVLVGATVALWLVTTIRHVVTGRARITDRDLHRMIERERQGDPQG